MCLMFDTVFGKNDMSCLSFPFFVTKSLKCDLGDQTDEEGEGVAIIKRRNLNRLVLYKMRNFLGCVPVYSLLGKRSDVGMGQGWGGGG